MFKTIYITTKDIEYNGNTVHNAVVDVAYSVDEYDHLNYIVPSDSGSTLYRVRPDMVPSDFIYNFLDYTFEAIQFELFSATKFRNGATYHTSVNSDYPLAITRTNSMGIFKTL